MKAEMTITKWDGKPITKAGIYSGIPLHIYHSQNICPGPSVSSSNLRRVLECNEGSPRHFYAEWSGGDKGESDDDTRPMVLGRAAHHLLLGQEDFRKHFLTRPPQFDSWRTNAAKAWRENVTGLGYTVITESELESIIAMARSIESVALRKSSDQEALVVQDLLRGKVECSIVWQDNATGLWVKSRPDVVLPTSWTDYVDMKITHSVSAPALFRTLSDFAYHQQAALVLQGVQHCLGVEPQHCMFALVFVESKSPYCVRVIEVDQQDIAKGIRQNNAALALIDRCLTENRWPGPGGYREIEHGFTLTQGYRERSERELEVLAKNAEAYRLASPRPKHKRV